MLFSAREDLEDEVVGKALIGPTTVQSLHEHLKRERGHITLRAVYKAVNKLIAVGVLLKPTKSVFVNGEWVREARNKLSTSRMLPNLERGERAAYTFVSVEHLDAFWTTIALQLEEENPDKEIFFYNPHNFWAYVPERKEAEEKYYSHFREAGQYGFLTIGGRAVADMEFKRSYQDEHFQVDARPIPSFKRTDHVTVIGDFVITVRLQKKAAEQIDTLYASNKSVENLGEGLAQIYRALVTRFVLENNPSKARRARKVLSRNFYFKNPRP